MVLTVEELYKSLEQLIEKYGDLEVKVTYDNKMGATSISNEEPEIILEPMREYSYVLFVGF